MIDFHSHILPGIDDGSASVEESLTMLHTSYQQGVRKIVATPHFYATKETPKHFLQRRETAWKSLLNTSHNADAINIVSSSSGTSDTSAIYGTSGLFNIPDIYLGAEVYYYTGISHTADLRRLCIENTDILLLEMPFHRWSERMIDEAISLARDAELTVLLAHIDRYLPYQTAQTWEILAECGVLFQVNASAFLGNWRDRRKACKLLKNDRIAVLGSDCHNMQDRPPNLAAAYTAIGEKFGEEAVKEMIKKADSLLSAHTLR